MRSRAPTPRTTWFPWRTIFKLVATAVAIAAGIVTSMELLDRVNERLTQWRGVDDPTLDVLYAELSPFKLAIDIPRERNQFWLAMRLRNYGVETVLLTAADITVENARSAGIGSGTLRGRCVLSADPDKSDLIEIRPGDEKWIRISRMVHLPGVGAWLSALPREQIHLIPPENPQLVSESYYVDHLNRFLAKRFGESARLLVTLYTGRRKPVRELTFHLARGQSVFADDGNLRHDHLIASWFSNDRGRAFVGSSTDCR